ncbi:MAG: PHP domain-containing protein [Candidatus Helarchaeota archaeon]|nr:PHP domain-containing protein [Candidatus Helarchaeota archaeon]
MSVLDFIKRNSFALIITVIFSIWMVYLIATSLSADRIVQFIDALPSPNPLINPEDVSGQYASVIPVSRYFIEPFVGLTFVFTFNSDPTEILVLFIVLYAITRGALLALDNTILNRNGKKEVLFRYIKNTLEFVVKWESILFLLGALILVAGLFIVGFIFVANLFCIFFHFAGILMVLLLIGKATYNAVIYFRPNVALKVKKLRAKKPVTKGLHRVKRELFYFWTAFLLIFTLNFFFLNIKFPTQQIVATPDLGPNEILCDFHVHTTMSDGHLTPEQRVLWYMEQGIDVAVFTDHHHPYGALRAKTFVEENNLDFTVLIGQEFTDDPEDLHLNLFGPEEAIIPDNYYFEGLYNPEGMNVSQAINYTKQLGGYVIVNHYSRNASAPFTYEQLVSWGVDGFEIGDGKGKYREIRDFILDYNIANPNNTLIALDGTDQHLNSELNTFVRLNLTDPTNRTLDHIMENLRRNNHSVINIKTPNYVDADIDEFKKLYNFHNYLANLDAFQALSWIIWSFIGYGLVMAVIWRVKKSNLEKMEGNLEVI